MTLKKIIISVFLLGVFFSCINGRKITLKDHDFGYKYVIHYNDFNFYIDLYFLKEYFQDCSATRMVYFIDSIVLVDKATYIDLTPMYADLSKNSYLISMYKTLINTSIRKKRIIIYDEERNRVKNIYVEKSSNYKYKIKSYYSKDRLIIKSGKIRKGRERMY